MVMGFFLDGEDMQQPKVLFSWHGIGDVSGFATGEKAIQKGDDVTGEPPNPAKPSYPHNKTMTTASGHVIEMDDTPGAERLHVYHKSGSYSEIDGSGNRVDKTTGNHFMIDLANSKVYVKGEYAIQAEGSINILSNGPTQISGNEIKVSSDTSIAITAGPKATIHAPSVLINGRPPLLI